MKYFEISLINLRTRCCESAASETVYVKACEERWRSVYSVILVIAMRSALDAEWPVAPHASHSVRTRTTCLFSGDARIASTAYSNAGALFLVGSMRFRSTVSTNHRVCDPMMIRFRFLLKLFFTLQRPCLDLRCQAPLLTYAAALLGPPLPGPLLTYYLRCSPAMMNRSWRDGGNGSIRRIPEADLRKIFEDLKRGPPPRCSFVSGT